MAFHGTAYIVADPFGGFAHQPVQPVPVQALFVFDVICDIPFRKSRAGFAVDGQIWRIPGVCDVQFGPASRTERKRQFRDLPIQRLLDFLITRFAAVDSGQDGINSAVRLAF